MRLKLFKSNSNTKVTDWHSWFAWHPVLIDGNLAWLERIERKFIIGATVYSCGHIYRFKENKCI